MIICKYFPINPTGPTVYYMQIMYVYVQYICRHLQYIWVQYEVKIWMLWSGVYRLNAFLKNQSQEIFWIRFFHQSASSSPIRDVLGPFRFFPQVGTSMGSRFPVSVNLQAHTTAFEATPTKNCLIVTLTIQKHLIFDLFFLA